MKGTPEALSGKGTRVPLYKCVRHDPELKGAGDYSGMIVG